MLYEYIGGISALIAIILVLETNANSNLGKAIEFPLPRSVENNIQFTFSIEAQKVTWSTWMLKYTTGDLMHFFSYDARSQTNNILFGEDPTGMFFFLAGGARNDFKVAIPANKWVFVVIVVGDDVSLYIDGVHRTTKPRPGQIKSDGCVVIGQDQDWFCGGFDKNQAFAGQMLDMNLYDYELSPDVIKKLYQFRRYQVPGNPPIITWNRLLSETLNGKLDVLLVPPFNRSKNKIKWTLTSNIPVAPSYVVLLFIAFWVTVRIGINCTSTLI